MSIREQYIGIMREARACNCVGPQNGQPRCPCLMQSVQIKDGRYVEAEKDLGPVSAYDQSRLTAK